MIVVGMGQDSHAFLPEGHVKPCVLGGVVIDHTPGFDADSDGDVILHALCNAITSVTHVPILGEIAIKMCLAGIKDSRAYLAKALETLHPLQLIHVALVIEGKRPRLQGDLPRIRHNVATLLNLSKEQVGLTVTSSQGLTPYGQGVGLYCNCIITVLREMSLKFDREATAQQRPSS